MTEQELEFVLRLSKAPDPRDLIEWQTKEGIYVAACRASREDVPALIRVLEQTRDADWLQTLTDAGVDDDTAAFLRVTAWRTLADLEATDAVEPLVAYLGACDDSFDDWVSEELPDVFGKIGEAAIGPLLRLVADERGAQFVRSVAASGLSRIGQHHPQSRDSVVAGLTESLARGTAEEIHINTTLLVALVDLHAVEAAEAIERAFADNRLDAGMMGDWDDVRHKLGVPGLGLRMPAEPYNSISELRKSLSPAFEQRFSSSDFADAEDEMEDWPELRARASTHASEYPTGYTVRLEPNTRVGRNDPCPCGSGKKFKKCCLGKA
jgi:HEAT repeat protein